MQAAFMRYPAKTNIQAHYHPEQKRTINTTAETVIVMKGELYVELFSSDGTFERALRLYAGDLIILYGGGHGFRTVEETEIIEVKQGPYIGNLDKVRL